MAAACKKRLSNRAVLWGKRPAMGKSWCGMQGTVVQESPDQLTLFPAADGKNTPVGEKKSIAAGLTDVAHIQENAAAAGKKAAGRDKVCGIQETKTRTQHRAGTGKEDVVTVGGDADKIFQRNPDGRGAEGKCGGKSRGGRSCPGSRDRKNDVLFRVITQLEQNLALQFPGELQNGIREKTDAAGRQIGNLNSDFLHKRSFRAEKMPFVPEPFSFYSESL